jgi:hypothetical protein
MAEEKIVYDKKEFIEKLKQLQKYMVGDRYFFISNNKISAGLVQKVAFECEDRGIRCTTKRSYTTEFKIVLWSGGSTIGLYPHQLFETKEQAAEFFLNENKVDHEVIKVKEPESNKKKVKDLLCLLETLDQEADISNRYEYILNSLGRLLYRDIVTTSEYWDCACEKEYIHVSEEKQCNICGLTREQGSDAIVKEIKAENMHKG